MTALTKLRVVFVGAGNLATQLGLAIQKANHQVVQVYSRTEASASLLAKRLACPYTTLLNKLVSDADLYVVALKDSVLMELLPQIVAGKRKDALFVHTAGSIPMEVWQEHVLHYGVFYPMQTFSKARDVEFAHIPVFVEAGQPSDLMILKQLGASLSQVVLEADSEQRRFLHLSAVFVCNFTNHALAIGEQLLGEHGLPFSVMYPLVRETMEKVLGGMNPTEAQTGPAVRYDENVMNKHLQLLASHPQWQVLYKEISKSIYNDKLRFKKD